jgi:hypothetical protein
MEVNTIAAIQRLSGEDALSMTKLKQQVSTQQTQLATQFLGPFLNEVA